MRESRTYGSVRGVRGDPHSYRDCSECAGRGMEPRNLYGVVYRISSLSEGKKRRRFVHSGRQQPFLALWQVRRDTTGVRDRGMYAQGQLGNLGEPTASLPILPE
jgi:hypothetical protein